MTIKQRKIKESAVLKSKIIKAAEELFFLGGYNELSMRKIAKLIDYSPTTIYRFFKNKEELLCAITDNAHLDLSKKFETIVEDRSLDSLEKLKLLIKEYARFGLEKVDVYRLYISLCTVEVRDNAIYETIGGKTYRIFGTWQMLLDELIRKGEIEGENPISTTMLIWNSVEGFIINRDNNPSLLWMSDEEEIDRLIHMIFHGILKK